MATTESAVVAIFGDSFAAKAAATELINNAFAGDRIHIAETQPVPSNPDSVGSSRVAHHEADVNHWSESVFGQNNQTERQHYEEAVRNGKALLGVTTPDQMVGEAADILNHYSPLETILARVPQQLTPVRRGGAQFKRRSLQPRR